MEQAKLENENMNKEKDRETQITVAEIQAGVSASKNESDSIHKDRELSIKERDTDIKDDEAGETSRSNQANEALDARKISEDSKNEDKKLAAAKKKESNAK